MMTIRAQFDVALRRITPLSPRHERTDPERRKNTEKSHTRLLVAASPRSHMEIF
jgi:hypothetical protein